MSEEQIVQEQDPSRERGAGLAAVSTAEVAGTSGDVEMDVVRVLRDRARDERGALLGVTLLLRGGVRDVRDLAREGLGFGAVRMQNVQGISHVNPALLEFVHLVETPGALLEVHCRVLRTERDHGSAREGRDTDHAVLQSDLEDLADPGDAVVENESPLGVRIPDFDRGAVVSDQDIVRAVGLGSECVLRDAEDEHGGVIEAYAVVDRRERHRDEGTGSALVATHAAPAVRLDVVSAVVEHEALADEYLPLLGGPVLGVHDDCDHARGYAGSGSHGLQEAHASVLLVRGLAGTSDQLACTHLLVLAEEFEERFREGGRVE